MIQNNMGASANIIVTQPRRISEIGVADRVAAERLEKVWRGWRICGKVEKVSKEESDRSGRSYDIVL